MMGTPYQNWKILLDEKQRLFRKLLQGTLLGSPVAFRRLLTLATARGKRCCWRLLIHARFGASFLSRSWTLETCSGVTRTGPYSCFSTFQCHWLWPCHHQVYYNVCGRDTLVKVTVSMLQFREWCFLKHIKPDAGQNEKIATIYLTGRA